MIKTKAIGCRLLDYKSKGVTSKWRLYFFYESQNLSLESERRKDIKSQSVALRQAQRPTSSATDKLKAQSSKLRVQSSEFSVQRSAFRVQSP